ncbi:MarR family winged helix-turn-helix transcriptional regulator [Rhodococcus koreensis]|uniref:DNA-binding transcriptional regulator, MarR family n=1 Tax=Rhodococcus koreensis TaxID=99653 RepID=A0A1H4KVA2_9NOCA|nr:winged helix DNA-binding protein [Rhodococcus koreensis]SEB62464.1 DNA-binding transcriptional regulator, MarR family [Rhodococcus koreensis]
MKQVDNTPEESGRSTMTLSVALSDLLHAQRALKHLLGALLQPHGLSYPRYELLNLVAGTADGTIDKVVLDHALDRHSTTTRTMLQGLECSGLVEWYRNPQDRRSTIVSITAAGRERIQRATRVLDNAMPSDRALFDCFTDTAHSLSLTLRDFLDVLERVSADMKSCP